MRLGNFQSLDLCLRLCRYVALLTCINPLYCPSDTSFRLCVSVGYCYDGNDQCYLPCAETINNNPFGGCSPGWDCPWFPDPAAGHCRSEMHPTQQFDIYRTSGQCCDAHFAGSSTCVQESKDSHPPFAWVSPLSVHLPCVGSLWLVGLHSLSHKQVLFIGLS